MIPLFLSLCLLGPASTPRRELLRERLRERVRETYRPRTDKFKMLRTEIVVREPEAGSPYHP